MRAPKDKILSRKELQRVVKALREEGKRIVFTNGCFDLLHVGHTRYLQKARELGDVLIVALNTDESVRHLKGEGRPLIPQAERAETIASLECVDYVTFFEEDTPVSLLESLKPDIHVKGGDYTTENLPEAEMVIGYGGYLVILPYEKGYSTTELIEKIRRA